MAELKQPRTPQSFKTEVYLVSFGIDRIGIPMAHLLKRGMGGCGELYTNLHLLMTRVIDEHKNGKLTRVEASKIMDKAFKFML
jgi:hypothetical protein